MKYFLAPIAALMVSLGVGTSVDRAGGAEIATGPISAIAQSPVGNVLATNTDHPLASYLDGSKMRDESPGALLTAYISLGILIIGFGVLYVYLKREPEV